MNIKNFEANIGFAGIILALSPFSENLKKTNLSSLFEFRITAFDLYFIFSCLLICFILLQLYFDIFYSKNSNSLRRLKYFKILNFLYLITITFIPLLTINLFFCEYFIETENGNKISISFFIFTVAVYFIVIYNSQFFSRLQNFENTEAIKNELQRNLSLASFLLQSNDLKRMAIVHHDIAKRYLLEISKTSYEDINRFSITDCIVSAWKKKNIGNDQKKQYENIARLWDYTNLEAENKIKKENLYLNNLFLEEELKSL